MGWRDRLKKYAETAADVSTLGAYTPVKERLGGGRSSSYVAPFNPIVSANRGDTASLKGAALGAGSGFLAGGIPGAVIGAAAGNFIGGKAGAAQAEADATRKAAMEQAIASQGAISGDMSARRQQDLDRTMGFYGPAMQALEHLYGIPASAWGQGLSQNRQAPKMPTGTLPGGQSVRQMPFGPGYEGTFKPLGTSPIANPGLKQLAPLPASLKPLGRMR